MFDSETEDGERHHYKVGVEATWSDCTTSDTSDILQPCLAGDHVATTSAPLLRNLLGDDLFTYIGDVFADHQHVTEESTEISAETEHCQLVYQLRYQKDLNDRFVISTVGTCLVILLSLVIFILLFKRIARRIISSNINKAKVTCKNGTSSEVFSTDDKIKANESQIIQKGHSFSCVSNAISSESEGDTKKDIAKYSGIPLAYQINVTNFHSQIPIK